MKKPLLLLLALSLSAYAVQTGEVPQKVVLSGDNGGTHDGKVWSSDMLVGKVHTVLYMDPDEREKAMPFLDELNRRNFDKKKYATVAIVNLAATWMPNAVLEAMLNKKEKELNNTEFIFDKTKYVLKKWKLKDDASNVLIFDAKEKLLYQKSGKLSSEDVEKIMKTISKNIE
jgi:predicted transcriptional regulator